MNRSITLTLKIVVLGILFAIIFYAIDWRDSYSVIAPDGETLSRVAGRILGDWNGSSITFVPNETSVPEIIREGVLPDGGQIVISPGLPTYIQNLDLFRSNHISELNYSLDHWNHIYNIHGYLVPKDPL